MGDAFIEFAKKLGIFMMFSQTILHFGIGKQYEKYLKLMISFMILAQLVSGFISFFSKNPLQSAAYDYTAAGYYEMWEANMDSFEDKLMEKQGDLEQRLAEQAASELPEETILSDTIEIAPVIIK